MSPPPWAEVHRRAVARGDRTYRDPATGWTVFTELFLLDRGFCCGSACRHCPYGHQEVSASRRVGLAPPVVVAEPSEQ